MADRLTSLGILACLVFSLAGCGEKSPRLSISTDPPGATVFVNWKFVGVTPVKDLPVEPGLHAVRIEKHNFKRWSQLVAVGNGPENLNIPLEITKRGQIDIASIPSNAEAYLDGELLRGKTPLVQSDLPYGTYDLLIVADEHDPWLGAVELKDDAAKVNAKLQSQMVDYFKRCIKNDPKDLFSYTELAHHYIIRKDFDDAVGCLTEALKISSRSPHYIDRDAVNRLYQELAKIYVGWFDYATDAEIKKLQPRIQEIVDRYGSNDTFRKQVASWGHQKDPNAQHQFDPRRANLDAIQNLQNLLKQQPNDIDLLVRISELYLRNYNVDEARQYLDRALKIDPNNYSVHIQLSGIYRRMGKHEEAEKELERATELCKDPVEKGNLHEKLAGVYQTRLTDADAVAQWSAKAVEQWQQAIKLADDPERACQRRFRLALLYRRIGEQDKALDLFKQIVENSQNEGLRNYARYFLKHAAQK